VGSGEGEAPFLQFGLQGQDLKALAPLAIPPPPLRGDDDAGMALDPDDVAALVFDQSIRRLRLVARRYPDPEVIYAEWFHLCVAALMASRSTAPLFDLLGLAARSVAFDAEYWAPGDAS